MPTRINLVEFMTKTATTLGRIEALQDDCKQDLLEMKISCATIPKIEIGLSNHLATHDRISKRFFYPIVVILAASTIIFLLKAIFHVNIF